MNATDISEAYYGVYRSSKEIIKNNQRHLFCNMLDLLASTCKTPNIMKGSKSNFDDQVQFWLGDLLPLIFDKDASIQSSALLTLEQGFTILDIALVQKSPHWSTFKRTIIEYSSDVHKLLENNNQYWHRVWCLLVRILDRETLRSASTINPFLSVVEIGFRSQENRIRGEAFLCWRQLIEIFHKYGELCSPKRMKLLCIPFKASQSKTEYAATVKLRAWWYMITCVGPQLGQYLENIVEPFLVFTFGTSARSNVSAAKQFDSVRGLATTCLAALLLTERNDFLERCFQTYSLEPLSQPSPLMSNGVLRQCWQAVVNATFEALRILPGEDLPVADRAEGHMIDLLLRPLIMAMFDFNIADFFSNFFMGLSQLVPQQTRAVLFTLNVIVTEKLSLSQSTEDYDQVAQVLKAFRTLLTKAKKAAPPAIVQNCVEQIFQLESLRTENHQARTLKTICDVITQADDDEDYDAFEIKLLVWSRVSDSLVGYLRSNALICRLTDFASELNRWILWPLRSCIVFAGRRGNPSFDDDFCKMWSQLLRLGQNSPDRQNSLADVKNALLDLLKSRREESSIPHCLEALIDAVLKCETKNSTLYREVLSLATAAVEQPLQPKAIELCLNTMRNFLTTLIQKNEASGVVGDVKKLISVSIRSGEKGHVEKVFLEDWKRGLMEALRTSSNKEFAEQIKEIFRSNDVFVIIPSVWSLNPDKLTERQKERYAEKAILPALYNDMSQSQDSLKPWTPNKVVIAKGDQSEIALEVPPTRSQGGKSDIEKDQLAKGIQITPGQIETRVRSSSSKRSKAAVNEVDKTPVITVDKPTPISQGSAASSDRKRSLRKKKDCSVKEDSYLDPLIVSGGGGGDKQCTDQISPDDKETQLDVEMIPPAGEEELQHSKKDIEADQDPKKKANHQTADLFSEAIISEELAITAIPNAITDPPYPKESSPKKTTTRITALSSPPDRKLTNNSTSPTLRPKPPSAHLTGRGAQFINMIRNRKVDVTPCSPATSTPKPIAGIGKSLRADGGTPSQESIGIIAEPTDHTSTPLQSSKDFLVFCKRLPSPTASPSVSILKRKLRRDSLEDSMIDSPALKRKRVSFHDPPVSVTKEYVRDSDENIKTKRCLILDKTSTGGTPETKHTLKRRSRLDSMVEIEKYSPKSGRLTAMNKSICELASKTIEAVDNNEYDIGESQAQGNAQGTLLVGVKDHQQFMMNEDNALNFVIQNYDLDVVLEKYFTTDGNGPLKLSITLAKFLSGYMSSNAKITSNVLETLSENHSKDFLDHAVQENLSSVVCDRLNLNSVIDYICEKSKINAACRSILCSKIPDILKHSRGELSERFNFVQTLIANSNLTDEHILDLISMLINARTENRIVSPKESESAVDSSSNL